MVELVLSNPPEVIVAHHDLIFQGYSLSTSVFNLHDTFAIRTDRLGFGRLSQVSEKPPLLCRVTGIEKLCEEPSYHSIVQVVMCLTPTESGKEQKGNPVVYHPTLQLRSLEILS